jgi:hypothetical protein
MRTALRRTLAVLVVTGIACLAGTAYAKPSGSWRIVFDHVADNEGTIVLRVAPIEGTPIDVEIKIPAKTTENGVADLVSDTLKAKLGSDNFRVGVDDGEEVVIKKRRKTKNFELTLVSNSLTGLSINIERH